MLLQCLTLWNMAEKKKFLKAKGDVTVITAIYYLRVNQAYSVSP